MKNIYQRQLYFKFEGHARQSKLMHAQVLKCSDIYLALWVQIINRKVSNQARALSIMGMNGAENISKWCIVQLKRMLVEEGPDKVKEISDILYKRAKILVDNGVIDASWKAKLKKDKVYKLWCGFYFVGDGNDYSDDSNLQLIKGIKGEIKKQLLDEYAKGNCPEVRIQISSLEDKDIVMSDFLNDILEN